MEQVFREAILIHTMTKYVIEIKSSMDLHQPDCLLQLNYMLSEKDGVVSVVPLVFRKTFERVLAAKLEDTGSIGGLQD